MAGRLPCLPQDINDQLMSLRLSLRGSKFTTIISVYASSRTTSDKTENKFYETCMPPLTSVPNSDILPALGDFDIVASCYLDQRLLPPTNAKVGDQNALAVATLGPLGYFLVQRRDQQDVLVTKAIPGAEAWTGHRLVISKMRARLQPLGGSQGKRTPVVTDKDASIENRRCQLRGTVQSTAPDVLGRARRQNQDWFDDDHEPVIGNLHSEKNRLHKAYANRPTEANEPAFYRCRRLVQQRLRKILMFSAKLLDERSGIRIANRVDSQPLNYQWMHFHLRVAAASFHDLLIADDFTHDSMTEEEMH
ncbi:hypothetical protein SprV_0802544900 [Sparganum proliferum]